MFIYILYGILGGMLYFLPALFYRGWAIFNSGPGGQNELGFLMALSCLPCGGTLITGGLAGLLAYKLEIVEPLTKSDFVDFIIPAAFGFVSTWLVLQGLNIF